MYLTHWADLLALLCLVFSCAFVTFPNGVLGQVWYILYRFPIFAFISALSMTKILMFQSTGIVSKYLNRNKLITGGNETVIYHWVTLGT